MYLEGVFFTLINKGLSTWKNILTFTHYRKTMLDSNYEPACTG